MNSTGEEARSTPIDGGHLILPAGVFGAGYVARTESSEIQSDWLKVRRWSSLAGSMVFPAVMITLLVRDATTAMPTLMQPPVFWAVILGSGFIPRMIGWSWSRYRRADLERVPWPAAGLDARLAFSLDPVSGKPGRAGAGFGLVLGVGLGLLCLSLVEKYPWNFGPLLVIPLMLCGQSVLVLIRGPRQASEEEERRDEEPVLPEQ